MGLLQIVFVFVSIGPYGAKRQNTTPPSYHFWISSNFYYFFLSGLHKYSFGVLKTCISKTAGRRDWPSEVSIQCVQDIFES